MAIAPTLRYSTDGRVGRADADPGIPVIELSGEGEGLRGGCVVKATAERPEGQLPARAAGAAFKEAVREQDEPFAER